MALRDRASFARLDKLQHIPQSAVLPIVGYALACPAGRQSGHSLRATKGDEAQAASGPTDTPQITCGASASFTRTVCVFPLRMTVNCMMSPPRFLAMAF